MTKSAEVYSITIINGRGYIFDSKCLAFARESFHISGVLIGVLPLYPQQNKFGGLPLQLLPEEVKYLHDSKEFKLINGKTYAESISHVENNSVTVPMQATTITTEASEPDNPDYIAPQKDRYEVYKYFMDRGFFLMPGLRFGCQFMAYPGDLLRYHSHYNASGLGWDEPFKMLDIINGGRLATSVKKCWVVGGSDPETADTEVFSIEWAQFG